MAALSAATGTVDSAWMLAFSVARFTVAPETPGSIHEGGELGYALVHAFGAAFELGEFFAVHVHAENAAIVSHERGDVQRLAARAGTGVDDALARLRV